MDNLLAPMVLVLAFLAVVLGSQTLLGLFMGARQHGQRVNRRLTLMASGMAPDQVYQALLRKPRASWIGRTPYGALHDRAAL
jgi:tight adherence protein B